MQVKALELGESDSNLLLGTKWLGSTREEVDARELVWNGLLVKNNEASALRLGGMKIMVKGIHQLSPPLWKCSTVMCDSHMALNLLIMDLRLLRLTNFTAKEYSV